MKFHGGSLEPPLTFKPRSKSNVTIIVPVLLTSITLLLTLIITLNFPTNFFDNLLKANNQYQNLEEAAVTHKPTKEEITDQETSSSSNLIQRSSDDECDIFTGEWVRNEEGPYYTNETCFTIEEHQNCMKFGRPDSDFMKWRWKPDGCGLPLFDPHGFLEMMKGKSLAFVGDSVGRNHMQSLVCLLSRVARPLDMSHDPERLHGNVNISDPENQHRRFVFREHEFNISFFWSPYLVKTGQINSTSNKNPFNLYLDEPDPYWPTQIRNFQYVIISAGHWFFRPAYFYLNGSLVGCLYCPETNLTGLLPSPVYFSYRRAFRTALKAINAAEGFGGVTFLRTFAPAHYEDGNWNDGGDCRRTRPFTRNETGLYDYSSEMYGIQLRIARRRAGRKRKVRLFDATKAMLLRPDGHPGRYGHWPEEIRVTPNDCVHWCLPGPIDSWNDMLQEMLRRENKY